MYQGSTHSSRRLRGMLVHVDSLGTRGRTQQLQRVCSPRPPTIINVVLPFAAAIALVEHNTLLGVRAQTLYETHPGLSSNAITRMMCAQLLLAHEPSGSCQQQGLHYIYQQTCQAKKCAECMMGRNIV